MLLIVLIVLFLFGDNSIYPFLGKLVPKNISITIVEEKPNINYIEETLPLAEMIKEKEDKIELCLINLEFSNRVEKYLGKNVNNQQLNDIYVGVNREHFNGRLKDKYDGLSDGLMSLLNKVIGSDVQILTKAQLKEMNRYFLALAWNLENAS